MGRTDGSSSQPGALYRTIGTSNGGYDDLDPEMDALLVEASQRVENELTSRENDAERMIGESLAVLVHHKAGC